MEQVRGRGVPIADGFGANPWDVESKLDTQIRSLYEDSKRCIWAELPDNFASDLPQAVLLETESKDREDYILHPQSGERLNQEAIARVRAIAAEQDTDYQVQMVVSDGLNALSLTDEGHLEPFLQALQSRLESSGLSVAPQQFVVRSGRVRAGYHIGELLFGSQPDLNAKKAILHVIGERPGSGHHAFSVYISAPSVERWSEPGKVDHNITKVVSGIADTALAPSEAAGQTVELLQALFSD
jgi:ethanolamine ammonia-lyase large subunit